MELKQSFGRNINITKELRKVYDDLQQGFAFQGLDAKYIFMLALALGYEKKAQREEIKRYPLLNVSSFEDEDLWLMVAIAVQETGNLTILKDSNQIKKIAEEYSKAGMQEIIMLSEEYGLGDNFLMEIERRGREAFRSFVDKL